MSREAPRPALRGLSALFWAAGVLVIVAAVQLFVLTERTDRYFAWEIAEPLTAAVDGAFYLAAALLLFPSAKARTWSAVRPLAWGVLTISTVKLVTTLLHAGLFHFDQGQLTARIAAWGWLIVYAVVPIALALLITAELRTSGREQASSVRMPDGFRWFAGVLACVLAVIAVALFLLPAVMADVWPWQLTHLTARDLAAWFGGIAVVGGLAVLDGDPIKARPVWAGSAALAVLQVVALARYPDSVEWGSATAWLYLALFAGVGVAGAWGWRGSVRSERASPATTASRST